MKINMEKLLLALFGIAFILVLADAQDLGRMRRLMLLRQRELALRRAGFPFGGRGIGGPGIPPPVAARLALMQRQRGGSGNIFGQQPTQVFPNVPNVVQIPSVTQTQGQPGDGQTGLTQAGSGQVGGQINVQTGGIGTGQTGRQQFGGSVPGNMGGQMIGATGVPISGPMGRPMSGTIGGPMGGSMGGPMGGTMRGPMGGPFGGGPVSGPMGGPSGPIGIGGPFRGSTGGPIGGPTGGPFGSQTGSQFGGPIGTSFGGQMTGPSFSSGGQFSTGFPSQRNQGSAIFPSQAAQGPIIRQRGPGFTSEGSFPPGLDFSGSSSASPRFPNGPALQFLDGGQVLGQSSPLTFPTGSDGFSSDVFSSSSSQSSGFPPGFTPGSISQRFGGVSAGGQGFRPATFGPGFDATPTRQNTGQSLGGAGQTVGGSSGQTQLGPNFGFVEPSNSAAGPAFTTGTQSAQDFNIQFQPLQPGPQVPQIPAQQPNQGQMGIGIGTNVQTNAGFNSGFSNQGSLGQDGLQFGGPGPAGLQTLTTDQNSKFTTTGGTTVVETRPNQQNGGITFGAENLSSNNAATTVLERTAEGGAQDGSTEFRLVEVGNILNDKGLVNVDATSESAVVMETTAGQQGPVFQPAGDINTAFRSFEAIDGSSNVVDLSLEPTVTMESNSATVSSNDATGSTIVTNTTETKTVTSVQDGPFAPTMNQDFSFFMTDNQAPNEMPPITFTAPEPPVLGSGELPPITFNAPEPPALGSEGTQTFTFDVQGTGATGNDMSNTSQSGFISSSTKTVTSSSGNTETGPVQPDAATVETINTAEGGFL